MLVNGLPKNTKTPSSFPDSLKAENYIALIPTLLADKGYWEARVDSVTWKANTVNAFVFTGPLYEWDKIETDTSGTQWPVSLTLPPVPVRMTPDSLIRFFNRQLESQGYPFALLTFAELQVTGFRATGLLKVEAGQPYLFRGIDQEGTLQIDEAFLYRYLELEPGTAFDAGNLYEIDARLATLEFAELEQPSEWNMLGDGGRLKIFLKSSKNNNINLIIGAMPQPQPSGKNKMLITGDADFLLRNAFGQGETMHAIWQQLQPQSPRLKLAYNQWYLFKSRYGVDGVFELYKQDSQFLQIHTRLGVPYQLARRQTVKVFVQFQKNIVGETDTQSVKYNRRLPAVADLSIRQLGISWLANRTDHAFNPRAGWFMELSLLGGMKKLIPNATILELKDPDFDFARLYDTVSLNGFTATALLNLEKYTPLGTGLVLKNSLNSGWLQSPQYYRNELFRLGGFHLLRGFDEQSIYARGYAVATTEFRWITGRNSFLFAFTDAGVANYHRAGGAGTDGFLGSGLGMQLEAGTSRIQISLAAGKQSGVPFNLRQTKLHVGFTNRF